ncbi:MAG: hypothetical protein K6D96_07355 [Acetatifactor sp.]|nr:hypothetical protein [Acetatifactor sp.]
MVFEDGSVLQQTIELEDNNTNILGESPSHIGIMSAMRTTFSDVKLSVSNGLCSGGFYATYVIDWNAHNDGIIAVKDPFCNVIGGSYSEMSVGINRSYESYANRKPAEATYTVNVHYTVLMGGSETFIIKMLVGNDKMVVGKIGTVSISY